LELQSKALSGFKQDSSDSDSSDSEVTINTSRLSNGGADTAKRKSIFGLTRVPASTVSPSKKLSKFDLLTQGMNLADKKEESIKRVVPEDSQEENNVENDTSDSEYETEEVYELREWYPPDFWRAKDQDSANRVCQTDVTANNLTVTMLESRVCDGFFKAL
jgi:hypothetical protein